MNSKHTCKFCKRSFPCGRSLGGHIRSHLIHKNNSSTPPQKEEPGVSRPRYELRENPKKTFRDSNLLLSSSSPWSDESDTEDGSDLNPRTRVPNNPNRRSSFHGGNNNNNSNNSSVSEVVESDQQEEIATAMCLIMLSRDVGNWGDYKNSQNLKSAASGHLQNGSKLKEIPGFSNGYPSNDQNNHPFMMMMNKRRAAADEQQTSASGYPRNMSKLKEFEIYPDDNNESGFEEIGKGAEIFKNNTYKRSKFECNTCNKVFHSYQALGGHRASHKKIEGMMKTSPISKPESNETFTNEDFVRDNPQELGPEIEIGSSSSLSSSQQLSPKNKVVKKHECPICFRVFSSGQALGGHKRSHLLAGNNSNCEINLVDKSGNPEIRDFLDLNLPPAPPAEEESANNPLVGLIKPYWWVENSHNHEPFLSLISN